MKRPLVVTQLLEELKRMPGIGQKTAERLSFFLMRGSAERANKLADAIRNVKNKIIICSQCNGITEINPCDICSDPKRDTSFICVVEEPHDVYAMENMGYFRGVYHVLMGAISPLDGIGPEQLNIRNLRNRIEKSAIKELIIATNPTVKGEATALYLQQEFAGKIPTITRLACGIPAGGDLEYVDDVTLIEAFSGRHKLYN